jgi:adenylate cyclase
MARPDRTPAPGDHGFRDRFARWIVEEGARTAAMPLLLDAFCRFLNAEGYCIHRCNLATDTVHPQMSGMRHAWFSEAVDPGPINPAVVVQRRQYEMGEALIDEIFFNANAQQSPQYRASPFWRVEQDGELYAPIRPLGQAQPFPVFDDLAQIGCTAYFGTELRSFAGMGQRIGLATSCPGGLTAPQIADLRWSISLATLHINTLVEFSIKTTLAQVYIGQDPGRRVCAGAISLGDVTDLEAAIWFSDLRGFTATSEALSPDALIRMLNDYLAAVVGPIYANGGEVLKYVGDAILAVFPTSNFAGALQACRAALAAAAEADARLAALNARFDALQLAPVRHGVGLHYGEVSYGNIGSQQRLDFTVIGRAVNIASRIESKTKALAEPLLCSAGFAETAGIAMRRLGDFQLDGVARPIAIGVPTPATGPPDPAPAP